MELSGAAPKMPERGSSVPAATPAIKVPCPLVSVEGTTARGLSLDNARLISFSVKTVP